MFNHNTIKIRHVQSQYITQIMTPAAKTFYSHVVSGEDFITHMHHILITHTHYTHSLHTLITHTLNFY